MPYPISDEFNDPQGRWDALAPWDGTMKSDDDVGVLPTQQHVDLRSFRSFVDVVPVPQYPDLDVPPQTPNLTGAFQRDLEEKFGTAFTEGWITSGTGINEIVLGDWDVTTNYVLDDIVEFNGRYYQSSGASLGDNPELGTPWAVFFFVGKIDARGGWPGLQVTTDGANLMASFESSIADDNVDISGQDTLSLIFPDYNTFTMANSTIELSSHADGTFTDAAYVSDAVPFSATLDSMPHMQFTLTDFTSGAGAEFTLTKVTGVRIYLEKTAAAPAAAETITIMAIRALDSAWVASWLDFDTRWGILYQPVTLTGAQYAGIVLQDFEFIRGDGTKNDPFPAEGAFTAFFYPGGETTPDAADPIENSMQIILREIKDVGAGTGSAIYARLFWNDTDARFEVTRVDTTGGSPGVQVDTTLHSEIINDILSPSSYYAWTVNLVGKSIYSELNVVNRSREIQNQVWKLVNINDTDFTFRNGRVGFIADLINRDAFLDAIIQAPLTYAVFRTQSYRSRTAVDGVKLSAVFSPDHNLFDSYDGTDILIDQTKTVSGAGSYRTRAGISTNLFVVEDWLNTYLDIAIWVPAGVTRSNQPIIFLDSGTAEHFLKTPTLQPAQWNQLHFDFGIFRDLITGLPYSLKIERARFPEKPLGFFWVDSTMIGRRKVLWSARALADAPFRRFNHLANNSKGAVHFNPNERGSDLQLQAEALTPDAWVVSFDLFPHYAELGLPLYDQAFEIR